MENPSLENIHPLGSLENPIIDSELSIEEALRPNPNFELSKEVFERQRVLPVIYFSFDDKYHKGQIVVDRDLQADVEDFFKLLLSKKFPVNKAVPIGDKKFNFDDNISMEKNNSSGFNPRPIAETTTPSNHAFGRAIDINPFQNPYIRDGIIQPSGAVYDITKEGTFVDKSEIVEFLKKQGWKWGGNYGDRKDYHHFEKPLEKKD